MLTGTRSSLLSAAGGVIIISAIEDERLVGSVQLALAWQANAPHRAEVRKMLVYSDYRRRGIGLQLLNKAEKVASQHDRWLLYLDTEHDSGGQALYERAGYLPLGIMPQHAINHSGEYADTIFFYKLLPHS